MDNDLNQAPYNYEDCVDASSAATGAIDTATDTFADWYNDDTTSFGDVINDATDAYFAYDHKQEVCDFDQDSDNSSTGWFNFGS
jgi:hypothetical protein